MGIYAAIAKESDAIDEDTLSFRNKLVEWTNDDETDDADLFKDVLPVRIMSDGMRYSIVTPGDTWIAQPVW